jgi:hypothetical protein
MSITATRKMPVPENMTSLVLMREKILIDIVSVPVWRKQEVFISPAGYRDERSTSFDRRVRA